MFYLFRNCQTVFQSSCTTLHAHQQYMRVLTSPYPCQHVIFVFLYQNHLSGWKVGSHCGFYLQASDGHNADHLFLRFMAICTRPLQKGLFISFTYFLKLGDLSFDYWVVKVVTYIVDYKYRIQIYALQIFFFSVL